jgi:hypothetical protein
VEIGGNPLNNLSGVSRSAEASERVEERTEVL